VESFSTLTLRKYPAFFVLSYSGLGSFFLVHPDPGPVLKNALFLQRPKATFYRVIYDGIQGGFELMLTPRELGTGRKDAKTTILEPLF
jgi:hypothetical protein